MNRAIQWFCLGLITGVIFTFAACEPSHADDGFCEPSGSTLHICGIPTDGAIACNYRQASDGSVYADWCQRPQKDQP